MATCNGCGITPVPPICTPVTTDTPVFFRPAGAHVPVPGFIRVTVAADCTQTVQHLDASLVAYGSLQPLVDVPYVSALGASGGGGGSSAVTIANGAAVPLGATTDAAAPSDGSGNYTVVAALKRLIIQAAGSLANWTTLLARIPAQAIAGLLPVDTLAQPGLARQLAAGAASANTALTANCRRISMHARGADIRYNIGAGVQTAEATAHFIASGERLDVDVPANANIAVIRAGSTNGTLEVTELL